MHFLARRCVDDDSLSYTYCATPPLGIHPGRCLHCGDAAEPGPEWRKFSGLISSSNVNAMIKESRRTFRFAPFGGEGFWCDALKLP
jgi:hypothetical protein